MGWAKIDYGFFRHPKVIGISKDAKFLYVAALCYCGENMTDGVIPSGAVRVLAAEIEVKNPARAAKELTACGLWKARNNAEFEVNDYLEYNESSSERKAKQEAARDRMQRNRSGNVRANNARTSDEVPGKFALLEEEVEEETSSSPHGELGAAAPADQSGLSEITPDAPADPSPDEPEKPWVPHGPDQQLVKWWSDFTGYPVPKMFGPAVGAAANLRKAGLKPEDAEDLYRFCDGIFPGDAVVTLQKMAGRYDEWQASKLPKRSPAPPAPSQPPRRAMAQSKDEIEQRAREFMGGSRGSA